MTASVALRRIYGILSPRRRRQLWLVLILSILGGLAELLAIGTIIPFLSILAGTGASREQLVVVTAIFIAAAVIAGLLRLTLAWFSQSFVQNTGHDLVTEIQRRILAQPYDYHVAHNSSEVVASLELVHHLTYGLIQPLLQAAAGIVIGLFVVAAVAAINLPIALAAATGFAIVYIMIASIFRGPLDQRSNTIANAYRERVRLVQESMGGIRDIIVDQSQAAHVEAFRAVDARLTRARTEAMLTGVAPRYLVETAGLVVLALATLALSRSAGGLSAALPTIGALALGAYRLLPLAHQLYQGWSLAAANRAIAAQIVGLLDLPTGNRTAAGPQVSRDRIEFRDLDFTYPDRSKPALTGVSLAIPAGSAVALTGPTGSGKSTLADLLMGLLTPSRGAILVDGEPLNAPAWQRGIAHVPQAIFLADASILRNIALAVPGAPPDRDRAEAAAKAAELGPFLDTLTDGLDTVVGERGVRLSGGQRQRIGIARALYKQANVLILDEATSALDEPTEAKIMATLAAIPGLTLLVIAHRPSTIARCAQVFRLEHGRLVAT